MQNPCPACKDNGWFDLANPETADRIRTWEQEKRQQIPNWIKIALAGSLACLSVLAFWIAAGSALVLGLGLLISLVLYFVLQRPASMLLLRLQKAFPVRWKLPVPLPDTKKSKPQEVTGYVEGKGPLLTAPFSGAPCLAWQVCVRFDVAGDARPPEWVLQEIESMDILINDIEIPNHRVLLETPLAPLSAKMCEEKGIDWRGFLKKRGLHSDEGTYELFESLIDPGSEVTVKCHRSPETYIVELPTRNPALRV
ncbi:MAG: hypothetical protein JRJ87_08960 [Deltaproteobacteria bacterium]|nr:hypothetical protein [Deltaproteobacteria bacterium]